MVKPGEMRGTLTLVVDVESVQKLTALRLKCEECMTDEGVNVIATDSGFDAHPFTCFGAIKGKPEESWRCVYLAENAEDAKAQAIKADPKRTVVAVIPGDVPAVMAA